MTGDRERILVVEDERAQREALIRYLERHGYEVHGVDTGELAIERLGDQWSVLITDLRLPGIDGLEVVRQARASDEELGVLLMTAFASVESAIDALRLGAHDYLLKPLILEDVARRVGALIAHRNLVRENARLRRVLQLQCEAPVSELAARSPAMQMVLAGVEPVARARAPALITGEPGSGKETVARLLHRLGPNPEAPLLTVALAGLDDATAGAELFGDHRGPKAAGVLRAAGEGTVVIDDIAALSTGHQARLLHVLESGELRPLGSDRAEPVAARIIALVGSDPEALVDAGRFRGALFQRLAVARIDVPPLRERPEDIPELVAALLERHARRAGVGIPVVSAEAMRGLCRHPWRGNVRELSNVLERAIIFCEGHLGLEDLPADIRDGVSHGFELQAAVDRFERGHIVMVLSLAGGNREAAAAELGISPATLYRRLERHGLKGQAVPVAGRANSER